MAGQGVLSLTIKNEVVLYAAYMPFVQYGGLFVPTNRSLELGGELFMLLQLLGEPEKIPVVGKVIWITPPRAQGERIRGVGIQFIEPEGTVRAKIENILAGQLESGKATHTL